MPFVQSAETLRSKLHLTDAKAASIAGACLAALAVVAFVVWGAIEAAAGGTVDVVEAQDLSDQTGLHDEGEARNASEDATAQYVHVTGAVARPGMYGLPEGARVHDAIEAAGGLTDEAAASAINLARIVADGEQIMVPSAADLESDAEGAEAAGAQGGAGVPGSGESFSSNGSIIGGKVNINRADAVQLDGLPGIGQSTAEKIIAEREANGPFSSKEDLQRVSGIGAKKYAQLESLICVG